MATSSPIIALRLLQGNAPTHLYPLQELLRPYLPLMIDAWITLWCITALMVLIQLIREYRESR